MNPSMLLQEFEQTPFDVGTNLDRALSWKSNIAGDQIKLIFQYRSLLDTLGNEPFLFGPFASVANFQKLFLETFLTNPLADAVHKAVKEGKDPDQFSEINSEIYTKYTQLLYELTGHVITDDVFDRQKAFALSHTPQGLSLLKSYLSEFMQLEYGYNSIGLTRLKAMKELLKALLITITETPPENCDLPYAKKGPDGALGQSFVDYLAENHQRFENLYREQAFDIKAYSERATGGKIGGSPYEVVPGSSMHCVSLRHYPPTLTGRANKMVLYLATPLINKPELFDLAPGKSVIEGFLNEGYEVYMVDYGEAGPEESNLGLDYFAQEVHDHYLRLIEERHPGCEIACVGYCMGGTLLLPYLARRAEERLADGKDMDIKKLVLMASPVKFDDNSSGHGPMRTFIRNNFDAIIMDAFFGNDNVPPQVIQFGLNAIQPGIQYTLTAGFYGRASFPGAIHDAAPFLFWLTHGTKFPARAHREWLENFFLGNRLVEGTYRLPASHPEMSGKPVDMGVLKKVGVRIFDYRGTRDPIAPSGSCIASELWGEVNDGNISMTRGGLNRTIEKNVGHIFVVSKPLLREYLEIVCTFLSSK